MDRHYIAAIGGSAGSLEALLKFFDHTPHDDVSYVIIQHLPANYHSQLGLVLERHSALTVKDATNGLAISRDYVYILPSRSYTRFIDGHFEMTPRTERVNQSIDIFLTSLVDQREYRNIAVILSGYGKDGSEGVIRIKMGGGFTLAQPPDTTEYPSMPASAIATGCVDRIIPVELMGTTIVDYVNRMKHLQHSDHHQ